MTRALGPGALTRRARGRGEPQWTLDWVSSDGRRRRQSLGTDKRVAERRRAELIRQRDLETAGLGSVEGQSRPLTELRDAYLDDLRFRATPGHVLNVAQKLARVLSRITATRVRDLKPYELMRFRNELLASGLAPRTVNLHTDSLRALLTWSIAAGLIAQNPIQTLKRVREDESTKRHRRRALSDDEIGRFLRAAYDDDRRNAACKFAAATVGTSSAHLVRRAPRSRVPQAPLWRAFLEVGARYGELVAVTWADLDFDRRVLVLRASNTKTRRERTIPLLDGLVGELRDLRAHHVAVLGRPLHPTDRVFLSASGCAWPKATTNVMRILDRLLEAAGIDRVDAQGKKIDVHALRGSCASRLARRGVPLVMTQRILGHSTVEMTARHYTHVGLDDLRAAVEQVAPRQPNTITPSVA